MLEPYRGEQIDIVVGMESRGFIFSAADGLPARRRPRPGPQAGQAAGRDDHGRVRPRVRLEHARDPPRRDPAGPEGPHRRRPARDRRHGPGHDRAGRAAARARSSAWRSSSSSTSSRAATGSTAAASRASSSTDERRRRAPAATTDPTRSRAHPDPTAIADRPRRAARRRARARPGADATPRSRAPRPPTRAVDLGRRRFFRQFAGELIQTAATVAGAAQAPPAGLGRGGRRDPRSRRPRRRARPGGDEPGAGTPAPARGPTGFRTPFREDGGVLFLIDQRRLPDGSSRSTRCRTRRRGRLRDPRDGRPRRAGDRPGRRRSGSPSRAEQPRDGPARTPAGRPSAARANALLNARPDGGQPALGGRAGDGPLRGGRRPVRGRRRRSPTRCGPRPTRSSFEATDRSRPAGRASGSTILPTSGDRPLRILTHCNTGPLACGQYGTALGVVQAAHHAERAVHVWVDETRPYLQGARLTAWELAQAGVPHTLLPDVAAGHLMARGEVDVDPRRGRPGRGQRRHRQQGRDVHAGRPRRAPRDPVLRLRADQLGRPRDAGRRRDRDRGAHGRRGRSSSAASASRRPAPRSATRRSTSRRPSSSPGSSPRRASSAAPFEAGLARRSTAADARWAAMPGCHAIRPPCRAPTPIDARRSPADGDD